MLSISQRDLQVRTQAVLSETQAGHTAIVRRYKTPISVIVGKDLWNDLLEAAGEDGQRIIAEYERRFWRDKAEAEKVSA